MLNRKHKPLEHYKKRYLKKTLDTPLPTLQRYPSPSPYFPSEGNERAHVEHKEATTSWGSMRK